MISLVDLTHLKKILPSGIKESRIYNLTGSSAALLLALFDEPFLAVEHTEELAKELYTDINFFREAFRKDTVFFLPDPDGPSLSGERAKAVYTFGENDSLVLSFRNLTSSIWSYEELQKRILRLEKHGEISRKEIEQKLIEVGYTNVPLVLGKGEYSRRGWLFDIFPSTSDSPVRIEFFGDQMESIRYFDIETQRSLEEASMLLVYPAKDPVSNITPFEFMDGARIFFSDSIQEKEGLRENITYFSRYPIKGVGYDAGTLSIRGLGIVPEERKHIEELPLKLKALEKESRIMIISPTMGQAERLKDILHDGGIIAPIIDKKDMFTYEGSVSIATGTLSSGIFFPNLLILTEKEIFGKRPSYRPIKKSEVSRILSSLDDLKQGDYIVHNDHGIGKFNGLIQQNIEGVTEELILIEYENGKLYIPLQRITGLQKYHAREGGVPRIDRLGGKTWQKTKERVQKKIHEMAEKIILLNAEREVFKGFSCSPDTELHTEFDSFFLYEETPDQIQAIEDIKKDMESDKPMDRLICGDVGYGKTEVAMRAAFKAVYDGRQAAVLVPTTILCEQHYRTFRNRFSAFPITIDYLSRFKSRKDQKKTVKALSHGEIDIIIGTQSLFGKDVCFYKLGLLIIDEEHRFGVRQKEKLKALKRGVDVLTLTATPIPRTLSMALSDIRSMSIIETPPEERLAIKSIVSVYNENLIQKVIQKELDRNGQVFFVHNRVESIYKIAQYLSGLLPMVRIAVAHGQMPERELESVMLRFYEGAIGLLVSTAIIGSGLDIPSVNTIIINRADMMGLADLYQLKGRVGRGNVRAYAYFLIPGEDIIPEKAKMRLKAIQEMSYLGAGFRLALKDLEIRGAGNLLGAEQSGHIDAVGFDLYMKMLEKAVAELRGMKIEEEPEPVINLKVTAIIPEGYIEDIPLRLSIYRKFASTKTQEALISLEGEIEDRFGKLPDEVKNLIKIMSLKIMARELSVTKIEDVHGKIRFQISRDTKVKPQAIVGLLQKSERKIRFLSDGFELDVHALTYQKVYEEIKHLFTCLTHF